MWFFTKKATAPIHLEALVAKPGDTIVLRSSRPFTPEQRLRVRDGVQKLMAEGGAKIIVVEPDFVPVVISGEAQ